MPLNLELASSRPMNAGGGAPIGETRGTVCVANLLPVRERALRADRS